MNLGTGVLLITLASMLLTWLMFGVGIDNSRKKQIIYWLKSTVFLWAALVLWALYKEPEISFVIVGGVSLVFSALANLLRSGWVFMLP
ncbi:hypothetical protein ASG35_22355 [Burkholderia sp. Leaf177]|nr:hypothetical protein ASG35_22355 [Burkholderia sp. Leaf177]